MSKIKHKLSLFKTKMLLLCLPGGVGFAVFFIYPFLKTAYYSLINNTHQKQFVFLGNYKTIINNQYFQLALKNTAIFSIVGVALILIISLLISFALIRLAEKSRIIKRFFIMPMVLPTAGVIYVWQMFFDNKSYDILLKDETFGGFFVVLPIYLLFLWKNTGMNVILITAAASKIPQVLYEAAVLDGASSKQLLRKLTLPLMSPTIFFVTILSFVNSLKIFKERYLFFGTAYPPDEAYILQYYMNNHFHRLNYQILSSATIIFTLIMAIIIIVFYTIENKFSGDSY